MLENSRENDVNCMVMNRQLFKMTNERFINGMLLRKCSKIIDDFKTSHCPVCNHGFQL